MKKTKILLISSSPRSKNNCPSEWGKSRKLSQWLMDNNPDFVDYDFLDLSVERDLSIQPCLGCVSTSMAHCGYQCSCYKKGMKTPDLLSEQDVYTRLEEADGIAVITPVHWYSVPAQLKTMFDRLVCINGGNPYPDLTEWKNKKLSKMLELLPEWDLISRNHLSGRCASFFVYGDGGANEIGPSGYPKILDEKTTYSPQEEEMWFGDVRTAVMPLVFQLRYSGINVRDEDIVGMIFGKNLPYSINNSIFEHQEDVFNRANELMFNFANYTKEKILKDGKSDPKKEKEQDKSRVDFTKLKKKLSGKDPDWKYLQEKLK